MRFEFSQVNVTHLVHQLHSFQLRSFTFHFRLKKGFIHMAFRSRYKRNQEKRIRCYRKTPKWTILVQRKNCTKRTSFLRPLPCMYVYRNTYWMRNYSLLTNVLLSNFSFTFYTKCWDRVHNCGARYMCTTHWAVPHPFYCRFCFFFFFCFFISETDAKTKRKYVYTPRYMLLVLFVHFLRVNVLFSV